MNEYENALRAMHLLLSGVGEEQWAAWIQEDIGHWQADRDVKHHLSAYGGMGTLNDVFLCDANGHKVSRDQEPWANVTFLWLKSLCFRLAHQPESAFTAAELRRVVGRDDAPLAAFVGGENASDSMRRFSTDFTELHGWRCLQCGYSETSPRDLEALLAEMSIPDLLFAAAERRELPLFVERIRTPSTIVSQSTRDRVLVAAEGIALRVLDREGWMQPCPVCGSDDTARYRWELTSDWRFEPSSDNLRLRSHAAN